MAPAPGPEKKPERGYFSSAVDSINPWSGSRSTTPTPKDPAPATSGTPPPPPFPANNNPGDHSTSHVYGQSFKKYPPDCPPLKVQWFHAVDVAKRKPKFLQSKKAADDSKPTAQPKKYVAFSPEDSRSIEVSYQTILEDLEKERESTLKRHPSRSQRSSTLASNNSVSRSIDGREIQHHIVHVQEDFLFQVDVEDRELSPVYWLGSVYDVRRGTWFYQEGSNLRACEENLAAQLEEGYLKTKPWTYPPRLRRNSAPKDKDKDKDLTPKASSDNLKGAAAAAAATAAGSTSSSTPAQADPGLKAPPAPAQHQPQTHRLFGTYMNSIATYQDSTVAWLTSDSMLSWVTSTMYERFAGGAYMSGVKLVRGYTEPNKAKDKEPKDSKDSKRPSTPPAAQSALALDERQQRLLKRRSAPPGSTASNPIDVDASPDHNRNETEGSRLQRQLSSLIEGSENRESQEEQVRQRDEKEMQDDYNAQAGETQGREIEHLVLVTHGIGQLLGLRMESVNFVHDVNVLRKTLKAVYSSSADLRALNSETMTTTGDGSGGPGNCRIQVLPVCWRHLLDFPKKREERKREHDLGEAYTEEDEYPSLEDITVEGVAFARSLISDLALDVLLYQSAYREQIAQIVLQESNRVYKLFIERNPGFNGKVHIMGHSLGSAIMFDILCRQKERPAGHHRNHHHHHHKKNESSFSRDPLRFWPSSSTMTQAAQGKPDPPSDPRELKFDFDVDDFYCLGSPVGLFQMLKGRTIAARHLPNSLPSESPLNPDHMDDPFLSATTTTTSTDSPDPSSSSGRRLVSSITGLPFSISSPKVSQLFNIFHPSDPIAYRMEPLISPAMSSLKSQALPYTKKGIFGSVAPQGITGIGAKVGQSVSGLWSSLSAGIASNILNRSLGLTQEDVANMTASVSAQQQQPNPSQAGAGTNISAGGVITADNGAARGERAAERKRQLAHTNSSSSGSGSSGIRAIGGGGNDATLLDDELETLYSRFQSRRLGDDDGGGKDGGERQGGGWNEEEDKARKLRREEMKVRALNRNGRVDYSIQESALDFNPINTIASHMSYWADEDVSHFIMSQLLSNRTRPGRGP